MDNVQTFLAHHGIKGQKWGIRRFQEEDGTLTAAGRSRYDVGINKSREFYKESKKEVRNLSYSTEPNSANDYTKARAKQEFAKNQYKNEKVYQKLDERKRKPGKRELDLIKKYKSEGMTQREAEASAYRRVRAEKIAAVAATVTIAAAASYVAYKHWDAVGDRFVKEGRTIQNLSLDGQKDVKSAFYGTFNKQDNSKYVGLFGGRHLANRGDVYAMNATVGKGGLKVAGDKNSQKILFDMLKNDASFRDLVKKRMNNIAERREFFGWDGTASAEEFRQHLATGKLTKNDYRFFNTLLVSHTPNQQIITDKFYEGLKKHGYGALMDVNDKWQSGYNAKSPIIIFNGAEKLINKTTTKLDPNVMAKGREFWENKLQKQEMRKIYVKTLAKSPNIIFDAAMIPAFIVGDKYMKRQEANEIHKKMIRKYKKEHPNTTLSNTDILRNIYGYT